ncbi:hypothetical protein ACERII_01615 [Evansella sp. AB-rgal1]|uniref:hypothetical protein n=1 Tax=Evansella sp. AB-rgal1 TaxID=3242696 RepID=UPI00359D356B
MESLVILGVLVIFMFFYVSFIFKDYGLSVKNYKGLLVPYSIGFIFVVLLSGDYLFTNYLVIDKYTYHYVFFIWLLGFIDDCFGSQFPKGIKGHFSILFREKEVTTGLIKAVGVVAFSIYYLVMKTDMTPTSLLVFALLVLFPHTMNLLDTKPLRVWKITAVTTVVPFFLLSERDAFFIFLFLVVCMWAIFESRMKAMLGDNGAMITGSVGAIVALQFNSTFYTLCLVFFCVFITVVAEKISIQSWLERTPVFRQIDQLGRKS